MENIKTWLDGVFSAVIFFVVSACTWLDLRLPHITMWLSFLSMLLSIIWWLCRYRNAWKNRNKKDYVYLP